MSRQDKATTERNARILRDLVKQPDNKSCADCRKNDARWASWNLGVFLCIRCSGIHRSMGTHISKVKSIDLDIWTPEQMDNIQRWGNRRANLYWERHLKKGHIPPDHKIESFIRSKYESRRWAMEGPPPRDPSVLEEGGGESSSPPTASPQQQTQQPRPTPTSQAPPAASAGARTHPLLSRQTGRSSASQARTAPAAPAPAPIIDLFGEDTSSPAAAPTAAPTAPTPTSPAATTAAAAPAPSQPQSNIFDLDFKAPAQPAKQQTAKADIMSLFSQAPSQPAAPSMGGGFFAATAAPPAVNPYGSWGGGITSTATQSPQQTTAPVPTWGGFNDQAAWGTPAQSQQPQAQQSSMGGSWGSPSQRQQQQSLWGVSQTADPWATPAQPTQPPVQKKDDRDPFANIWG